MRRNKGSGSVYYDSERRKWVGSFVDPFTGKRKKDRFDTKQEAEKYVANATTDILNDNYITGQLTFGEWMIDWLKVYKQKKVKPSTFDNYVNRLKMFEALYNIQLTKLTPVAFQRIFNMMTCAPATQRNALSVINSMLNKAVKLGFMKSNPAKCVELEPYRKEKIEVFTTEEIRKILDYYTSKKNYRYFTIFYLMANTGIRVGEALALTWADINLKQGTVRVDETAYYRKASIGHIIGSPKSNNSVRMVHIGAKTVAVLTAYRNIAKLVQLDGLAFPTKNGTPIIYDQIRKSYKATLKRIGIPHKKIHTLRHTHATMLLSNGVALTEVANRLGDSTTVILKNYAHFIPSKAQEVAEITEQLYKL